MVEPLKVTPIPVVISSFNLVIFACPLWFCLNPTSYWFSEIKSWWIGGTTIYE